MRVSVQFRIFKVIKVDIASGELSLKIWRRSVWFDNRLKWDPAEWGGIQSFRVYPTKQGEQVDDQLWLPPIVTTNTLARESDTLEDGGTWIRSDGRVWRSVPGVIDLSCRFTGLVAFPEDHLSCPMELGSWTYSNKVVNLTYFNNDLPWGWPDAPYAKGYVWTNVGPNRPTNRLASTDDGLGQPTELVNSALASALRDKMAQVRALPGETSFTLRFTAQEFDKLGVTSVRRSNFVNVDGNYYVSEDPLPCAEMGAQSRASGSSYQVCLLLRHRDCCSNPAPSLPLSQEYEVTHVDCLTNTRTYPVDPEDHWTSLWLVVHIKRTSTTYFMLAIILPGVIITLLSFGPLWLDVTKSGERISFGATMLLTILVLMTLVGEVVPRCGEMLWIHLMNWVNFGFCVLAMLESFVVYYICFGDSGGDTAHELADAVAEQSDCAIEKEKIKDKRWREETNARNIDYWNRRILPASYLVVLASITAIRPNDGYSDNYAAPTFQGFWARNEVYHERLWFLITTLVIIFVLCLFQFRRLLIHVVGQWRKNAATSANTFAHF